MSLCSSQFAGLAATGDEGGYAFGCAGEAFEETAAFLGWVGAHIAAISLARDAAKATVVEVGGVTATLVAAAFTFGYTSARYLQCLASD